MPWLRSFVACLLMVLVPLQSVAAASKLCCLMQGHARTVTHGSDMAGKAAAHSDALSGQARHVSATGAVARASAVTFNSPGTAECAVCAALCHSVALPPATPECRQHQVLHGVPSYTPEASVSLPTSVLERPPRV